MGILVCRICSKRSLKVKSMIAPYLKIHRFHEVYKPCAKVMLLLKSSQLFALLLYYNCCMLNNQCTIY